MGVSRRFHFVTFSIASSSRFLTRSCCTYNQSYGRLVRCVSFTTLEGPVIILSREREQPARMCGRGISSCTYFGFSRGFHLGWFSYEYEFEGLVRSAHRREWEKEGSRTRRDELVSRSPSRGVSNAVNFPNRRARK